MAISLYLGLPGDGKSMSGVRKLVSVLTQGGRYVVTNLPMELGELESYLNVNFPKVGGWGEVYRRVVVMPQSAVRKFWLYRADGWRLVDLADEDWSRNQFPSLQRVFRWKCSDGYEKRGDIESMSCDEVFRFVRSGEIEEGDLGRLKLEACYIIDEAQNFWPARSYQTTPKGLLFYLSQHRHVGDDCVFITQKESQVEKVVRNLVMEFWVFRNLGQRKRLGFKLPNVFGFSCYMEPPSGQGAQYQSIGTFRMDTAGLAKCYRTADGVGVGGPTMEADATRVRSGPSWRWAVGIFVVLCVVAGWLPGGLSKVLERLLLGEKKVPVVTTNQVAGVVKSGFEKPVERVVITNVVLREVVVVTNVVGVPKTNTVRIVSAMKVGSGWHVVLSDGRQVGPDQFYRSIETSFSGLQGIELERGSGLLRWQF